MCRIKLNLMISVLSLLAFSFSAIAGDYAVVRYLEGKAYVQGSTSSEREALTSNSPLFEGDNIWIVDGNIGILFGDGSLIWLSSDSHLEITSLPDPVPDPPLGFRAHLWRGLMLLEVPASIPYESSHFIMTPAASVKAYKKGLSLIEVETVDRTRLTVLEGSAVIGSNGQYSTINQREMSYAEYGYEPMPASSIGNFSYPDIVSFRNHNIAKPVRNGRSREYVDPELYPYADDLDYYGGWQEVPSYGNVWFPSPLYLGAGWNPYYNGYWHYTPWGTTWVSYEPWGWVPFHYGRWTFVIGVGWGWIPDSFFSPAWVSWYWGDGWIGWCPLGYWGSPLWEPCGWYSVQINQIYVTNVTKVVSVHKQDPPPGKPIIPVSKAGMKGIDVRKSPQKGGDVLITPHGGLNIPPSKLQDLQGRKIAQDDIKRIISEPPASSRDRKFSPPSSLERPKAGSDDEPVIGRGQGSAPSSDRAAPSSPRTRTWDGDAEPSRQSPDYNEPVRNSQGRSRTYDIDRSEPSREPASTRDSQRQEQPARNVPARETPAQREQPKSSDTPKTDRSGDKNISPPAQSYSQPPSSSSSSSKSNTKTKQQRSSLKKSSKSFLTASSSSKHKKNRV
jgi:hypothetical protein